MFFPKSLSYTVRLDFATAPLQCSAVRPFSLLWLYSPHLVHAAILPMRYSVCPRTSATSPSVLARILAAAGPRHGTAANLPPSRLLAVAPQATHHHLLPLTSRSL